MAECLLAEDTTSSSTYINAGGVRNGILLASKLSPGGSTCYVTFVLVT